MANDQSDSLKQKLHEIKNTITELWDTVRSDKHISKDEKNLMDSIESSIKNYESKIDQLLQQPEIGEEGLAELHSLEKKIVQDASATAFADGEVTGDERSILSTLLQKFEKLNE